MCMAAQGPSHSLATRPEGTEQEFTGYLLGREYFPVCLT